LSGILEAIYAELQAIKAALAQPNQSFGAPPQQQYTGQIGTPQQQYAPQQLPPQQAPVQTPPQNITADTILALIQPHIGNPTTKEALGGAMRAMGINALPETQPHQFAELYARFQAVLAAPQQAPPVQSTSII